MGSLKSHSTDSLDSVFYELQSTSFVESSVVQAESDKTSLLDSQPENNNTSSNNTIDEKADQDLSHVKGFYNATDSNEVVDLTVEGQLPEWLTGEVYTIGPGIFDIRYLKKIEVDGVLQSATGTYTFGHWFDALPLVNRIDLNGQRNIATYRNRIPNKKLAEKIRDHHGYAPPFPGGLFNTDSNQTFLIKFLDDGKSLKPDRVPCGQRILTSLPGIDGRLFAQDLANHIVELDPFDLKATHLQTFNEINPDFKGYTSSPNGQYDPNTGEYINFTMEIGYRSTKYHFFSISPQEPKGQTIATIWNAPTGWTNQFVLTENHIVMVIHPMLANTGAVRFAWSESILSSFDFYPSEPSLFYLISRQDREVVAVYRTGSSFSFNSLNAFEDIQGNVVVDLVGYPDDGITRALSIESLRTQAKVPRGQVRRYCLGRAGRDVYRANQTFIPSAVSITSRVGSVWNYFMGYSKENATGSSGWHAWIPVVEPEVLSEVPLELPQVHPAYRMRPYTFVYGLGFHSVHEDPIWNSIVKLDVTKGMEVASWYEEGCYPSEAQFIPQPSSQVEDEGVLVSVVMDSSRSTSFLLVLDAKDLKVLSKIPLERLVPLSFAHGAYKLTSSS